MFEKELRDLEKAGLRRSLLHRSSCQGPRMLLAKKQYLNFASNDYLGFAAEPVLAQAASEALRTRCVGAGASRLLAGGGTLHRRLEEAVASFKNTDAALVFNSGYSANTGIIPALASGNSVILSDELNHASIIDGCRLSGAKTRIYRHRDVFHLERILKGLGGQRPLIVTDTVFSMDGDIAPLPEILRLSRHYNAILCLDDAHGTGVLGKGRGALAHFGIEPAPRILQIGTFSKALGSFGAFVAGDAGSIEWILNTARSFLFSTALPESIVAASYAALREVRRSGRRIKMLWRNRDLLVRQICDAGFDVSGSETPIFPVRMPDIASALSLSRFLFLQGIYAPAIRPPTVVQPRVRITVTAAHTEDEICRLGAAMKLWRKRQGQRFGIR